jgi:putative tryptophan/tyrosine transport system substrate-binding protein
MAAHRTRAAAGDAGCRVLELLHELVPTATTMALLLNPASPYAERLSGEVQTAARTLGIELHVLQAGTEREIDTVFAKLSNCVPARS